MTRGAETVLLTRDRKGTRKDGHGTYMREIYLDNSATTQCFEQVADLMHRIQTEDYGNPSSMHHKGIEAERIVEDARRTLARILKVKEKELIFTSCGTESDNLAIIGGALAGHRRGKHLITTRIEHPAVLEAMKYLESEGFEVTYLPVDRDGLVDPADVEAAVRGDTILVSIMHTNNEIGAVEPVAEIGRRIKAKNPGTLFHVDAVQGFGKARIYPAKMGIDLLAVSAHKIHGPKGMGFLYKAQNVRLVNLIYGGGQQNGMRSGTENVAGIAGMAHAADMIYKNFDEEIARVRGLKNLFLEELARMDGQQGENALFVNGRTGEDSAPHIISLTVPGVRAEVLLHALEDKGIYVSSGSACSTNRPHPSQTLQAIGLPRAYWDNTIRLSLSALNTEEDIRDTIAALGELVPFLRRYTRH